MTNCLVKKFPYNTLFGKLVRLPLRLIPKTAIFTVKTGINRGMKWIIGSSVHGCWIGNYETEKQAIVKQLIKPGVTVFDIGGNAGFYTLAFSRLVGKGGHVWTFEPFAENIRNLLDHVRLNQLSNVKIMQTAISEKEDIVDFQIAEHNAMGKMARGGSVYKVSTFSLDYLIANGNVPIPDVIKMDVEGAESLVLSGALKMLSLNKTVLMIALHGEVQRRECYQILDQLGYKIFLLNRQPITAVDQLTEDEIYASPYDVSL